jgi:hypothetical protein
MGHMLGTVVISNFDVASGKLVERLIVRPDGGVQVLGPGLEVASDMTVAGRTVLHGHVAIGPSKGSAATEPDSDVVLQAAGNVEVEGKLKVKDGLVVTNGYVHLCAAAGTKDNAQPDTQCTVQVDSDLQLGGDLIVSKGLSVEGDARIGSSLGVDGTMLVQGSMRVQETAVFESDGQIDGKATIGQGLSVASGGVQVEAGDVSVSEGDVTVLKGRVTLAWEEAELVVEGTRESESVDTGAVTIKAGGLGVAQSVSVGGVLRVGERGAQIEGPIHGR